MNLKKRNKIIADNYNQLNTKVINKINRFNIDQHTKDDLKQDVFIFIIDQLDGLPDNIDYAEKLLNNMIKWGVSNALKSKKNKHILNNMEIELFDIYSCDDCFEDAIIEKISTEDVIQLISQTYNSQYVTYINLRLQGFNKIECARAMHLSAPRITQIHNLIVKFLHKNFII